MKKNWEPIKDYQGPNKRLRTDEFDIEGFEVDD
jgi:hypothetical protein